MERFTNCWFAPPSTGIEVDFILTRPWYFQLAVVLESRQMLPYHPEQRRIADRR